jgi:hypothetical protein
MPAKLDTLSPPLYQNLLLSLLAGLSFYLAFLINNLLGSAILYDNWIALFFLPAGIKHLFLLTTRGWGALGCFVALLVPSLQFWTDTPVYQVVLYCGLSTLASWLGIELGVQLLGIRRDLQNLKFLHLPVLDLITTSIHGFVVNTYFLTVGMTSDHLLASSLAMMFGDFTGSFAVLACLWIALHWIKYKNHTRNVNKL